MSLRRVGVAVEDVDGEQQQAAAAAAVSAAPAVGVVTDTGAAIELQPLRGESSDLLNKQRLALTMLSAAQKNDADGESVC